MSENKIFNILHVISQLPIGGAEKMLLNVVEHLNRNQFRNIICCIKEGGTIADELRRRGWRVEILNAMKGHGLDLRAILALYKIMRNENIHILRTYQYHANFYGRVAGVIAGVPVIIASFHNLYNFPNKIKYHRRLLNRLLSFFSDALVAVSNAVASDIIQYDRVNASKLKIIYNGISLNEFDVDTTQQEARKMLNFPLDLFLVGTIGNLTEQKGHRFLIEAASGMKDLCIVIAGDGPLKITLRNLAYKCKVNCIFMGVVTPSKIPFFLKALDIFCFPSLWEGFGNAALEAMAIGLPIVVSDIPPLRELIGDAGIFVPSGNSDSIAKSFKILKDISLRRDFQQKAKERAKIFSIQNTVKAYENLFTEILKKKNLL